MAAATRQLHLPLTRDGALAACRDSAQALGWTVKTEGQAAGLDVEVPGSWRLLRRPAQLRIQLQDTDGGITVTATAELRALRPASSRQADEIAEAFIGVLDGGKPAGLRAGQWSPAKLLIRVIVTALAGLALGIAVGVNLPTKTAKQTKPGREKQVRSLPSVALGQGGLYRLEIGLVVFYGGLILLTPFFYGVIRGRLPIEVSARGAKFSEDVAESVDQSIEQTQTVANELEKRVDGVEAKLVRARLNIDQLAQGTQTTLDD